MIEWSDIKWFTPDEFADPDFSGSGELIDMILALNLDYLRGMAGVPIKIQNKVGGAVDMEGRHGHSDNSYHLFKNGCKAADFYFTELDFITPCKSILPRAQYKLVERQGFGGIGVYYDWGIPVGFHVDLRPLEKFQRWTRRNGEYFYLLS